GRHELAIPDPETGGESGRFGGGDPRGDQLGDLDIRIVYRLSFAKNVEHGAVLSDSGGDVDADGVLVSRFRLLPDPEVELEGRIVGGLLQRHQPPVKSLAVHGDPCDVDAAGG